MGFSNKLFQKAFSVERGVCVCVGGGGGSVPSNFIVFLSMMAKFEVLVKFHKLLLNSASLENYDVLFCFEFPYLSFTLLNFTFFIFRPIWLKFSTGVQSGVLI